VFLWLKRIGLLAIAGIYLFYLYIYTDDISGYRWINENYYFNELWAATALIALALLVVTIFEHRRMAGAGRTWRTYRAFITAAALAVLFPVFAGALAMISYASSV
jgi:hypothetical protein